VEYCYDGSLCDFLQLNQTTILEKTKMCYDAAAGLSYMHKNNMIHVDVAARNCLYSKKHVKIGDFGLARILPNEINYVNITPNENLPLKYLAPDTYAYKILGKTTDVWSYGILSWEIWSNGGNAI